MNNDSQTPELLEQVPEPEVNSNRRFSLVWLVPIAAAVVGLVLAVKTITERGPTITIAFSAAQGLEAGKTRIKYKDVEVGRVEAIVLDKDLSRVKVTASMVPEMAPYLTESTRFWVVRPRVTASEISGLSTLFSGSYIAMDPGRPGDKETHFEGLEIPPVVTGEASGSYFNLRAQKLGSLSTGAPVYFRQIQVGQVVSYQMKPDGSAIDIRVFIQSPHDDQVNQNTRFWNASGLDIAAGATGIRINTESLTTLINGGIAFETPTNLVPGGPVDKKAHVFTLYESHDQIGEPVYLNRVYFVSFFNETVRGLNVGAPVEFRGIKVGEVVDIRLEFDPKTVSFRIPVLSYVEPERIAVIGGQRRQDKDNKILAELVKKGLRAQLRSGVLLTGQLYVHLDIYPNAKPKTLQFASGYPELPTVPEPVQEIASSLASILERIQKLPIEQIGSDLSETVKHANQLVGSKDLMEAIIALNKTLDQLQHFATQLNEDLGPQASDALAQSRQALTAAEKVLNADAPLTHELRQALKAMSRAARAVGELAEVLERNPQALIYGKGETQ